jgi:hypothetical protein
MNISTSFSKQMMPSTRGAAESPAEPSFKQESAERDYYSALVGMVAEISQDQTELRRFIYDFARLKLRKELYPTFLDGAWSEVNQQIRALDTAIDRIESDFLRGSPSLQFNSSSASPNPKRSSLPIHRSGTQIRTTIGDGPIQARSLLLGSPNYDSSALSVISEDSDRVAKTFLGRHLRSAFWRRFQLAFVIGIGLGIYATTDPRLLVKRLAEVWLDPPVQITSTVNLEKEEDVAVGRKPSPAESNETHRDRATTLPLPTEYGIYGVINGQLTELEELPIKVPDARVEISAAISVPSRTHFLTGQLQFIAFRRDLMNNAPDRISVRVLARVMRALTFDAGGHAKKTDVEQSWVIRSKSYQLRVGPLGDNPEMVVIHPDPADFTFPAGRYVLVIKGIGYDFTVDGPVTDITHCVERTDALNVPIYSECRNL